jgi:hypothetical protein
MVSSTPYECLEHIARYVASQVPDQDSLVRVEVEFAGESFDVQFVSTPYRPNQLYDKSLSTELSVGVELFANVRMWLSEYLIHARSWSNQLERLTLTIAIDGSFSMGQTERQREAR